MTPMPAPSQDRSRPAPTRLRVRALLSRTTLLLAIALVVGCGFAPRGALKVPDGFGAIAVTAADPYSPLADGLRRDLNRAGAATSTEVAGAARLAITAEVWETRPLSVDAFVAVREVETRYTVTFDLLDAQGGKRLDQQTVGLTRDYVYEAAESFGNPGEQEIVQHELRRDMQAAILRRVDLALRSD